jgi:hypothetical protein
VQALWVLRPATIFQETVVKFCINSPDEHFIVDKLPEYEDQVLIAAVLAAMVSNLLP